MITILAFVFVLGVLVFIHELGHFLVARKVGIKVDSFSLGFPPNIFEKKVGDTTYCLGLIPLGGYVKMAGESPDEKSTGADNEFMSKTVGQRAAVIIAGPFMNYILAIFLFFTISYFWGQPLFDDSQIIVGDLSDDHPAMMAGMEVDDVIISINDRPVHNFDTLRTLINSKIEEKVYLSWVRGTDTLSAEMVTKGVPIMLEDGSMDTLGIIGFTQKIVGFQRFGFVESAQIGFDRTNLFIVETFKFLKKLVFGEISTKMLGGPIFIAQQSGKEARKGLVYILGLMAMLSVNLAVLNVLPIPVLDGGHLLFLLIEKIKGSPVSLLMRARAQQVGMLILFTLIIAVTYNDIMRMFFPS